MKATIRNCSSLALILLAVLAAGMAVRSRFRKIGDREPPSTPDPSGTEPLASAATGPFTFEECALELGVSFTYFRGDTGNLWTVEPHGGGVVLFDYDNDGRLDLCFVTGVQLPPDPAATGPAAELFRNDGARFTPVAEAAGARAVLYGQGCTSADFDNDGFADLFLTGYRRCLFLQNHGDGTFADVTRSAGCLGGDWNTGATFADLDRDGCLDLYVANYLHFEPEKHSPCLSQFEELSYCGPSNYTALFDHLYRNRGDGGFDEVSESAGTRLPYGPAFGSVATDVDGDGWPDLLVANDGRPNFLFHNQSAQAPPGSIRLREVAMAWGIGVNGAGMPEANMGIACGDFDQDGLVDFGISHFHQEHYTLYKNLGSRGFLDVTETMGLDHTTRSKMGWGTGFFDADADGWLDLFAVNGHLNNFPKRQIPYEMTPQLFQNQSGRYFAEVSAAAGPYFRSKWIGRGTAVGDLDDDGRQDLVVVHHHAPAAVLLNRTPLVHHRILLSLEGTLSNRDAVGARAVATIVDPDGTERRLLREVIAGEGYLGANDRRLFFGLGPATTLHSLELHWPSGTVTRHTHLPADHHWRLLESRSPEVIAPLPKQ